MDDPITPRAVPMHASMTQFPALRRELLIGGTPLALLASRIGQTPFDAYGRSAVRERVATLRRALPPAIKLHYTMKANPMPALVGFMAGLVDGIDVASAGELKVALDAGADVQEISFAGPGNREAELRQAAASRVLVNEESMSELQLPEAVCCELGPPARVALRVNPDFELKGSGMRMGGGPKQFGIDVEQVPAALTAIGEAGFGLRGGSNCSPARQPRRTARTMRHCQNPM